MSQSKIVTIKSNAFAHGYLRMDGVGVTAPVGPGGGVVNVQYYSGPWEKFRLTTDANNVSTFESVQFPGVFLRMDGTGVTAPSGPGGGTVNCQFGAGPWEKYTISTDANNVSTIESIQFSGVFLRLDASGVTEPTGPGGGVVNCQFGAGDWERFRLLRVRQDVNKLPANDETLHWYALAVTELKSRPLTDPTSWTYMAAVHGITGQRSQFWNQCQHQSWYFLPWHRAYLAYFEQVVAAAVVKVGGPAGWSLPYWNYSVSDPTARRLPAAFTNQFMPDGVTPNPLWVSQRNNSVYLSDPIVSLECLTQSPFSGSTGGGDPGFGGPKTGFNHGIGPNGDLEAVPHNTVHSAIGGWMGAVETAALDPIFWLHHANIDRLWEVWLNRNPSFINPADPAWLTGVSFSLHDAGGNVVTFTSSQMVDTTKVLDGYIYEDISDPIPPSGALLGARPAFMTEAEPTPPTLVGASATSIPVGAMTVVPVVFHQESIRSLLEAGAAAPEAGRTFLNLENVTGNGPSANYKVYVDVPSAGNRKDARHFAGLLSTFGVENASQPDGPHAGNGITRVIEITALVQQLRTEGHWDDQQLHVTLELMSPSSEDAAFAAEAATVPDIQLGRVSVYHG